MVTDDQLRDRGQIILIAAVVIAFIVLGVVVVFNGVLYTETISSSSTSQSTADAELVDQELEAAVVDLGRHANERSLGESEFRDALEEEDDGLLDQYQKTKANSQPVLVDIEVDDVIDGTAGVALGNERIDPAGPGDDFELEYLELDVTDPGDGIEIYANATDPDPDMTLVIEEAAGETGYDISDGVETCTINADTIRLDLIFGETRMGADCSDDLEFFEEDNYNYIDIIESGPESPDGTIDYSTRSPSVGDDILEVTLDVTYESNTVSYRDEGKEIRIKGRSQ